jgi:membrane-associated phospholipid phosphatase
LEIDRALQSFPSGHATSAFSSFAFLSLYFAGKCRSAGFLRAPLTFISILPAIFFATSVLIDHHHHLRDVIAGSLLGSICAYVAYRSYFGDKTKHQPLKMDGHIESTLGSSSSDEDEMV